MAFNAGGGPLRFLMNSALGQWAVVGAGAYALFPDRMSDLFGPSLQRAMYVLLAPPNGGYPMQQSLPSPYAPIPAQVAYALPPPTAGAAAASGVIETTSSILEVLVPRPATLFTYSLAAGAIWGTYSLFHDYLPEAVRNLLPVSRNVFDSAITNLGKGILAVRETLGKKQEELSRKQDDMTQRQKEFGVRQESMSHDVRAIRVDLTDTREQLGEARQDLSDIQESVLRCESSLQKTQRTTTYTSRGVKLLVRCVASLMPDNDFASELKRYSVEGDALELGPSRIIRHSAPPTTPVHSPQAFVANANINSIPQITEREHDTAAADLMKLIRDGSISVKINS